MFPHQLVRLILAEQLYRAQQHAGHPRIIIQLTNNRQRTDYQRRDAFPAAYAPDIYIHHRAVAHSAWLLVMRCLVPKRRMMRMDVWIGC